MPDRAGIRAQVVTKSVQAVHDFMHAQTDRTQRMYNAPLPAATSILPVGEMVAQKCSNNKI